MGAISWLVTIGLFLIATVVGIWNFTEVNRTALIWVVGFPGGFFVLIGACLELQRFSIPFETTEAEMAALRPYVIADALEFREFNGTKPIEGWVRLKNTGVTTALNLQRGANIMFAPYPAESFPEIKLSDAKGVLGPKGEVDLGPMHLPIILTSAQNTELISGAYAIYLFGTITYDDKFGRSYSTSFRSYYRGNGRFPDPGTVLPLVQAKEGNLIW